MQSSSVHYRAVSGAKNARAPAAKLQALVALELALSNLSSCLWQDHMAVKHAVMAEELHCITQPSATGESSNAGSGETETRGEEWSQGKHLSARELSHPHGGRLTLGPPKFCAGGRPVTMSDAASGLQKMTSRWRANGNPGRQCLTRPEGTGCKQMTGPTAR
ncbi:hypothetical protein OE88DRAFT_1646209 [Heliocybe sulcata]|uniref:Uncharacterized protein n=1 Tax=Heliocybe sulcata TaxID=5364 RepID=A0A5C3MWX2_9AGAM|nr:hypothetical protein OE88DRAFT_1646209 [Heliocybe sulcata]